MAVIYSAHPLQSCWSKTLRGASLIPDYCCLRDEASASLVIPEQTHLGSLLSPLPLSPSCGLLATSFPDHLRQGECSHQGSGVRRGPPRPPAHQLAAESAKTGWGFLTHQGSSSAGGHSQPPALPSPATAVLTAPADSLPSQIREYGLVPLFSSALSPHSTTFILRCKIRTETTGSALSIDFSQSEGSGHFLVFTLKTWMAES